MAVDDAAPRAPRQGPVALADLFDSALNDLAPKPRPPAPEPVDPDEEWLHQAKTLRMRARDLLRKLDHAARRSLAPAAEIARHRTAVLGAGDTVVLLSDGITDADAVGLEALLCRFQSQDQQELADTVLAYAKAHTPADRRDDMSVIVARLLPN